MGIVIIVGYDQSASPIGCYCYCWSNQVKILGVENASSASFCSLSISIRILYDCVVYISNLSNHHVHCFSADRVFQKP